MEKAAVAATKPKNKFLKLIPKAAQAVAISFQNIPFSPRPLKSHHTKGFSGPLGPLIPAGARRKSKNFDTQEPTSPKVSCIGQVKYKNKIPNNNNKKKKKKPVSLGKELKPVSSSPRPEKSKKKKPSGMDRIFGRKADAPPIDRGAGAAESTPCLSQMRKFASSRETFANFDWTTAQIAPEEDRGFYSDGERGYSDDEDDVIIPFSAPILMAGGGDLEPRKEINLWKRRTTTPPTPLQLNIDGED